MIWDPNSIAQAAAAITIKLPTNTNGTPITIGNLTTGQQNGSNTLRTIDAYVSANTQVNAVSGLEGVVYNNPLDSFTFVTGSNPGTIFSMPSTLTISADMGSGQGTDGQLIPADTGEQQSTTTPTGTVNPNVVVDGVSELEATWGAVAGVGGSLGVGAVLFKPSPTVGAGTFQTSQVTQTVGSDTYTVTFNGPGQETGTPGENDATEPLRSAATSSGGGPEGPNELEIQLAQYNNTLTQAAAQAITGKPGQSMVTSLGLLNGAFVLHNTEDAIQTGNGPGQETLIDASHADDLIPVDGTNRSALDGTNITLIDEVDALGLANANSKVLNSTLLTGTPVLDEPETPLQSSQWLNISSFTPVDEVDVFPNSSQGTLGPPNGKTVGMFTGLQPGNLNTQADELFFDFTDFVESNKTNDGGADGTDQATIDWGDTATTQDGAALGDKATIIQDTVDSYTDPIKVGWTGDRTEAFQAYVGFSGDMSGLETDIDGTMYAPVVTWSNQDLPDPSNPSGDKKDPVDPPDQPPSDHDDPGRTTIASVSFIASDNDDNPPQSGQSEFAPQGKPTNPIPTDFNPDGALGSIVGSTVFSINTNGFQNLSLNTLNAQNLTGLDLHGQNLTGTLQNIANIHNFTDALQNITNDHNFTGTFQNLTNGYNFSGSFVSADAADGNDAPTLTRGQRFTGLNANAIGFNTNGFSGTGNNWGGEGNPGYRFVSVNNDNPTNRVAEPSIEPSAAKINDAAKVAEDELKVLIKEGGDIPQGTDANDSGHVGVTYSPTLQLPPGLNISGHQNSVGDTSGVINELWDTATNWWDTVGQGLVSFFGGTNPQPLPDDNDGSTDII